MAYVDELQDELTELRVQNWQLKVENDKKSEKSRESTLYSNSLQSNLEEELMDERSLRIEAEERLKQAETDYKKAELDWNTLSEQVEIEMKMNQDKLQESLDALEKLKEENKQLRSVLELKNRKQNG